MTAKRRHIEEETFISSNETLMLEKLQDILLRKDRKQLELLQKTLEDKKLLSEKVSPIIEEHLLFMKQNFPKEFRESVEKIIDVKLQKSQEEILNLIYPKLGKMIQKYVQHQFQQLKDNIDRKIQERLNRGSIGWFRRKVFGINISDDILSDADDPELQQIFVIQRNSGLLIGSASKEEKIHEDVVAGMLTAIKSFAEDAFEIGESDLEMIQYDTYRILMQTFPNYYIAVVSGGSMSTRQKSKLVSTLNTFAEKELNVMPVNIGSDFTQLVRARLKKYFFD